MLKVLECFSGIGACSKALTNLGIEHEIVDSVEIDKYAVQSFNAVHSTSFEPQGKLTPKECWRLMGFDDEDFDKAKASGVSDSQLYKQAGNSIVVKVLEGILRNLLTDQ